MIILLIQKNKKADNYKDSKESFREHDEVMKKFRLAHPDLEVVTDKDILIGDGNLLAPVRYVRLSENARN